MKSLDELDDMTAQEREQEQEDQIAYRNSAKRRDGVRFFKRLAFKHPVRLSALMWLLVKNTVKGFEKYFCAKTIALR